MQLAAFVDSQNTCHAASAIICRPTQACAGFAPSSWNTWVVPGHPANARTCTQLSAQHHEVSSLSTYERHTPSLYMFPSCTTS